MTALFVNTITSSQNFSQMGKATQTPCAQLLRKFTCMENIDNKPVGQIVAEYYRSYPVFESHKIDYYNKGTQSLQEAAEAHKTDLQELRNELAKKKDAATEEDEDFNSWPLDALSDYIIETHHRYADKQI